MEVPRGAFHHHLKDGGIPFGFIGREFFPDGSYGQGEIFGLDRGGSQLLDGIPTLGDRLSSLIYRALESLFRFARTLREQVRNGLKAKQDSVKTLQQRIVQVPRDSSPLADTLFHAHVE